jgi:hypothetical protein
MAGYWGDFRIMNPLILMACAGQEITSYPLLVVSGAGTSSVNSQYYYIGLFNNKPSYNGWNPQTNAIAIVWSGIQWQIITTGQVIQYYSNDDVATPDLVTTWIADSGSPPVPTVAIL